MLLRQYPAHVRFRLLCILALAAGLRLPGLDLAGLIQDEYFQVFAAIQPADLSSFLSLIRENPLHILVDPLATFLAARVSVSLWWLRLPPLVLGLAAILVIWRLGSRCLGEGPALGAALLLAVSAMHVEWSRRIDYYSLLVVLTTAHALLFLRIVEHPARWGAYCCCSIIFLHSHPYALVMGALHGLSLMTGLAGRQRADARNAFFRAWIVAAACFLPWFCFSTRALVSRKFFALGEIGWNPGVWEFIVGAPYFLAQPDQLYGKLDGWRPFPGVAAAIYLALYLVSLGDAVRRAGSVSMRLVHFFFVAGLAAIVVLDAYHRYFFAPYQLMLVLPFYLLAVAHGASLSLKGVSRAFSLPAPSALGIGLCLALILLSLPINVSHTSSEIRTGEGLAGIVQTIREHALPGDACIFPDDTLAQAFLYHYDLSAFVASRGFFLADGYLVYDIPTGLRAGPSRIEIVVRRSLTAPAPAPPAAAWQFSGELGNLFVVPPVRHRRPI